MDQHTDTDTSSNMTKIQEERLRELLYRAHREARQRLTYFLLAADGAAIAYALTQTQSAKIAWSQIPLAIAVISWGLSFYCGLRHLRYVNRNLFANFNLIELESSKHAESNDILQFTNNGRDFKKNIHFRHLALSIPNIGCNILHYMARAGNVSPHNNTALKHT